MPDQRFLLLRLSSLGDVIHTIPAAAALRETFPDARIDWVIDPKYTRLLEANPAIDEVIPLDRKSVGDIVSTVHQLRATHYSCAIDFQSLYKSALLSFASGAPRRIGFERAYAREGLAAFFYTDRLSPRGAHKVDHNLSLAEGAGARKMRLLHFSLLIRTEDDDSAEHELASAGLSSFFVLHPGGGWISKCWPPDRYAALHQRLAERYGWRGIVSYGPGEERLAGDIVRAAGNPAPVAMSLSLGPLMALLRRAKFFVSADTGPLHLASALSAPVVGLYGPTDPARNGPYSNAGIVIRNPQSCLTSYRRGASYSAAMLSITVDQVLEAISRLPGLQP
jgi:lipopolysaccharide heptosyltransferase I